MPKIVTTIARAFDPASGTGPSGKPWTRTDFELGTGVKVQTFKGEVASVARALVGQPVEVEYEETQNGQYTNRTLLSVSAIANGDHATPATANPSPDSSNNHTLSTQTVAEPERQLRIMRQSALDRALTAFGIAGQDPIEHQSELFDLARVYVDFFTTGE